MHAQRRAEQSPLARVLFSGICADLLFFVVPVGDCKCPAAADVNAKGVSVRVGGGIKELSSDGPPSHAFTARNQDSGV